MNFGFPLGSWAHVRTCLPLTQRSGCGWKADWPSSRVRRCAATTCVACVYTLIHCGQHIALILWPCWARREVRSITASSSLLDRCLRVNQCICGYSEKIFTVTNTCVGRAAMLGTRSSNRLCTCHRPTTSPQAHHRPPSVVSWYAVWRKFNPGFWPTKALFGGCWRVVGGKCPTTAIAHSPPTHRASGRGRHGAGGFRVDGYRAAAGGRRGPAAVGTSPHGQLRTAAGEPPPPLLLLPHRSPPSWLAREGWHACFMKLRPLSRISSLVLYNTHQRIAGTVLVCTHKISQEGSIVARLKIGLALLL